MRLYMRIKMSAKCYSRPEIFARSPACLFALVLPTTTIHRLHAAIDHSQNSRLISHRRIFVICFRLLIERRALVD